MMEHNEKYMQSVDEDQLYDEQTASLEEGTGKEPPYIVILPDIERKAFKQLNPASTTSSLEQNIEEA